MSHVPQGCRLLEQTDETPLARSTGLVSLLDALPRAGQRRTFSTKRPESPAQPTKSHRRGGAAGQPALVDYGGYLTFGYLSFDDSTHDNHALASTSWSATGGVNFDGVNELYARGRADYYNYNPATASSNGRTSRRPRRGRMVSVRSAALLHRRIAASAIADDLTLKAGPAVRDWGNGLTLDQYADGARVEFRHEPLSLDLLACVTVEGNDRLRQQPSRFRSQHASRLLRRAPRAGPIGQQNPYAYFLLQQDYNRDESADHAHHSHAIPLQQLLRRRRLQRRHLAIISPTPPKSASKAADGLSSSFDARQRRTRSAQTHDSIDAYAGDVAARLPAQRRAPDAILRSGNRRIRRQRPCETPPDTFNGNRPHTIDHAFNGLGVIYDGLAFAPPVSNLLVLPAGSVDLSLSTWIFRGLQAGGDFFVFGKTRARLRRSTSRPATAITWAASRTCSSTGRSPMT